MRIIRMVLISLSLLCVANGELRTWTLADGRTFEAAISSQDRHGGEKIRLVDANGKELSIPLDQFSIEDQEYVDITRVPAIDIDLLRKLPQVLFSSKEAERSNESRDPEIRARFGVRVKMTGTGTYNHELKAEIFAIGRQIYADRYMLLYRESVSFRLTKENDRRFEHLGHRSVTLRDFYLGDFAHRGEKYHGYLILVTDKFGHVVAHKESPEWLFDYKENMMKLKPGNYFDNQCVRRPPIRPEPVVDLSF